MPGGNDSSGTTRPPGSWPEHLVEPTQRITTAALIHMRVDGRRFVSERQVVATILWNWVQAAPPIRRLCDLASAR